ncbi:MAG TPA: alpha/beta hydrolase [Verrucomicrobiae bacterium]|nr:alpha/beta hydrolase [Verrucomicrobiae bacterium]
MTLRSQYADVNGVCLHYAIGGAGPLMLFVHGFPQFWRAWEHLLPDFARDHTVCAPDMRGINLSSKPDGVKAYHVTQQTEDLRELVRHLGFERCILVAHDWGGACAWHFAMTHPDLVDKLVIINAPHPVPYARELRHNPKQREVSGYMSFFRLDKAEGLLRENDFERMARLFRDWGAAGGARADAATVSLYKEAWAQPGALTAALNYYRASPLYPADPPERVPQLAARDFQVKVPTLVIWGEADTALLPELLDGLDECVPDLRIERIREGSHWVIHEFPERVSALIRGFLEA